MKAIRIAFFGFQRAATALMNLTAPADQATLFRCTCLAACTRFLGSEYLLRATRCPLEETSPLRARFNILIRMLQTQSAIQVLIDQGFFAEAGILSLTQLEMALDAEYVGDNGLRAKEWIEHAKLKEQPWPVNLKIASLKSNDRFFFSFLSAIKHGNPLVSSVSLNLFQTKKYTRSFSTIFCGMSTIYLLRALITFGSANQPGDLKQFVDVPKLRMDVRDILVMMKGALKDVRDEIDLWPSDFFAKSGERPD